MISYSRNIARYHDMETIIEAAARLRDHEDILFLFIGEGQKKQYLMDYSEREGFTNTRFHTYVVKYDLVYSLSMADIGLISMSHGQEGLCVPSKTYGYWAAGVPVIGIMTAFFETARVIDEEECDVYCEQGCSEELVEAILKLKNDPERLRRMSANAHRIIAEHYNLHAVADLYEELVLRHQIG